MIEIAGLKMVLDDAKLQHQGAIAEKAAPVIPIELWRIQEIAADIYLAGVSLIQSCRIRHILIHSRGEIISGRHVSNTGI